MQSVGKVSQLRLPGLSCIVPTKSICLAFCHERLQRVLTDNTDDVVYPPPKDGSHLHQWILPHAGIPIGELWDLEALSQACALHKKWTFLLMSAPLNIKGLVASPPNAIALL